MRASPYVVQQTTWNCFTWMIVQHYLYVSMYQHRDSSSITRVYIYIYICHRLECRRRRAGGGRSAQDRRGMPSRSPLTACTYLVHTYSCVVLILRLITNYNNGLRQCLLDAKCSTTINSIAANSLRVFGTVCTVWCIKMGSSATTTINRWRSLILHM